jgi:hypothetical protein
MESGGTALSLLTSKLDDTALPHSSPCQFTPEERALITCCIGDLMCPTAGLDTAEKKNIYSSRKSNFNSSVIHPVV